jgi:hypothetical protein
MMAVDPLIKIFKDSPLPAIPYVIDAVRGESSAAQIVLIADHGGVFELINPVTLSCGASTIRGKMSFIGYVPVSRNTPDTSTGELLREAPALFPDPILDTENLEVQQGQTQPIWLSLDIPLDQSPGTYTGKAAVLCGSREIGCEIRAVIHESILPEKRNLFLTNWFWPHRLAQCFDVRSWSEGHWDLITAVAGDLASHRQNVIFTPILDLIRLYREDGALKADFSAFDRWVELFDRHGVAELIEGSHLGMREGNKWAAENFVLNPVTIYRLPGAAPERIEGARAGSGRCRKFLAEFLPLLRRHLADKGWLGRYIQHIADEPTKENVESWLTLSESVKQLIPEARRVDAVMAEEVRNNIEIWVPLLNKYYERKEFFDSCKTAGSGMWFYTCLIPSGIYPNRFIDFSLLKTRLLHWINFRHGLTGYLHWGYNSWTNEPFADTERLQSDGTRLPPGDNAVVYPGRKGVISSLRWEALKKGVEDYELLLGLGRRRPSLAIDIGSKVIPDIGHCVNDNAVFNSVRSELINTLDGLGAG